MARTVALALGNAASALSIFIAAVCAAMVLYSERQLPEGRVEFPRAQFEGAFVEAPSLRLVEHLDNAREGRRVVVLEKDWLYLAYLASTDDGPFPLPITVSRYFVTDFASVPFPFNRIISPFGEHAEAAILHDWLYAAGEAGRRALADEVFYRAMKTSGVPYLRRRLMHAAVRIGGGRAYGRAEEWTGSFLEPLTETRLRGNCLISKKTIDDYYRADVNAPFGEPLDYSYLTLRTGLDGPDMLSKEVLAKLKERAAKIAILRNAPKNMGLYGKEWTSVLSSSECSRLLFENFEWRTGEQVTRLGFLLPALRGDSEIFVRSETNAAIENLTLPRDLPVYRALVDAACRDEFRVEESYGPFQAAPAFCPTGGE